MQSGEVSRYCQQILLFSAGRVPHSSRLMPPLQKSLKRTPSTGWKSTPNKAPSVSGAWHPGGRCGAELPREPGTGAASGPVWFWHKPYFFFFSWKLVVKKHVAGIEPIFGATPAWYQLLPLHRRCCSHVSFSSAGLQSPLCFARSAAEAGFAALLPPHIPLGLPKLDTLSRSSPGSRCSHAPWRASTVPLTPCGAGPRVLAAPAPAASALGLVRAARGLGKISLLLPGLPGPH